MISSTEAAATSSIAIDEPPNHPATVCSTPLLSWPWPLSRSSITSASGQGAARPAAISPPRISTPRVNAFRSGRP